MSLKEIERAVERLVPSDLAAFSQWFEEYLADTWDQQIEEDARSGKLDSAMQKADDDFEAGRCTPL